MATTMRAMEGFRALVLAHPAQFVEGLGPVAAWVDATHGTALRCYVCETCGYVELYYAPVAAPLEWNNG